MTNSTKKWKMNCHQRNPWRIRFTVVGSLGWKMLMLTSCIWLEYVGIMIFVGPFLWPPYTPFPSQVAVLELEDRKGRIEIVYTAHLDVLFGCLFGLSREFNPKIILLVGILSTKHDTQCSNSVPVFGAVNGYCVSATTFRKSHEFRWRPKRRPPNSLKVGPMMRWELIVGDSNKDGDRWMLGIFSYLLRCVFVCV